MKGDVHLDEVELAGLDDSPAVTWPPEAAEHLRWCARCRSTVADYTWLSDELTAVLHTAANTMRSPCPPWHTMRARMYAGQRREMRVRFSALACAVLLTCALFLASSVLGFGAFMDQPTRVESGRLARVLPPYTVASAATPTPALSHSLVTPALVLPPTPPERLSMTLPYRGGER